MRWRISVSSVCWTVAGGSCQTRGLLRVEQVGVAVQQLVHHRAPVVAGADDGLAQRTVGLAPRILHLPKVRPQADRERIHLANAFHGLLGREFCDAACLHIIELLLQVSNAALQMLGAALRVGVERGGQVVDFALHHRQARRGGGHQPRPSSYAMSHKSGFQRIGFKHPPSRSTTSPRRISPQILAPGLVQLSLLSIS